MERPEEVSSRKEKRIRPLKIGDPRFNQDTFNPLRHSKNYEFLYRREGEEIEEGKKMGANLRSRESRREGREKYLRRLELGKERMEVERELVRKGKTPFFVSGRRRKVMEVADEVKRRGEQAVLGRLAKKEKERENRSIRKCI